MAIKYLTSIDLSQNELLRPRLENYAGNPAVTPVVPGLEGQIIWDSVNDTIMVHNGTNWTTVDTKYSISSEAGTGVAILRLTGTNGVTDDVTFQGDSTISISRAGASLINIIHGTNDGQLHVPATGTTNNGKYLRAGSAAGVMTWDEINLGTDTAGNYVAGLTAGTGVSINNPVGEGNTATISIGQSVAPTDTVTFAGATLGSVQIGVATETTIAATTGGLHLDSLDGNVYVDDNLLVQGNLTVNGTVTTVNTQTINLADNIITLNSDETGTPTQNGGIEVERGTLPNAAIIWNESIDRWTFTNDGSTYHNIALPTEYTYYAGNGIGLTDKTFFVNAGAGLVQDGDGLSHADTSTLSGIQGSTGVSSITVDSFGHVTGISTATYMRRYVATFGDATNLTYNLNHGLGTADVIVSLYEVSTNAVVYADIVVNSTQVSITLNAAPGVNTLRVVVIG